MDWLVPSRTFLLKTNNVKIFRLSCLFILALAVYSSDARLFGNIPPPRGGGGGILFGGGGGPERGHAGPGVGKQPPQNILGRIKTSDDADEGGDPRNPPKSGRMRLGPILFDPEHLVMIL